MRASLLFFVCIGCGGAVSEQDFVGEYVKRVCDAGVACLDEFAYPPTWTDPAGCEEFLQPYISSLASGCEYDEDAGSACVQDVADASCADLESGAFIGSCGQVYSGDCQWATYASNAN